VPGNLGEIFCGLYDTANSSSSTSSSLSAPTQEHREEGKFLDLIPSFFFGGEGGGLKS
jgi:hypothetical protein